MSFSICNEYDRKRLADSLCWCLYGVFGRLVGIAIIKKGNRIKFRATFKKEDLFLDKLTIYFKEIYGIDINFVLIGKPGIFWESESTWINVRDITDKLLNVLELNKISREFAANISNLWSRGRTTASIYNSTRDEYTIKVFSEENTPDIDRLELVKLIETKYGIINNIAGLDTIDKCCMFTGIIGNKEKLDILQVITKLSE